MRGERLEKLRTDVQWARGLAGQCSLEAKKKLHQLDAETATLDAVARAQQLQRAARALAADHDHRPGTAEERARLVAEVMRLLRDWKARPEVAKALTGALLDMVEVGGEDFKDEMDRGGLTVLASTVGNIHIGRPNVARNALELLRHTSVEMLILFLENHIAGNRMMVSLGLEILNKCGADPKKLEDVARYGGRELLQDVESSWGGDQTITMQAVTLRHKLRRCRVKSLRPRLKVELPPEEVVRLRGCFEAVDKDESGYVDVEELMMAFQMVGVRLKRRELEEAFAAVDVDGSGRIEWPEFLWLMSKFGAGMGAESSFTGQRLDELREVFARFDDDGNGQLDIKELAAVMRSVGLSPTDFELRALISEVDADGSGSIDWPEFLHLMSKKMPDPENQHRLAYELFVKDARKGIFKADFVKSIRAISSEFSENELEEMVAQAKAGKDTDPEVISYKEFVKIMMRP